MKRLSKRSLRSAVLSFLAITFLIIFWLKKRADEAEYYSNEDFSVKNPFLINIDDSIREPSAFLFDSNDEFDVDMKDLKNDDQFTNVISSFILEDI